MPFETIQQTFPPETHECFIAIGSTHANRVRASKYRVAKQKGYHLASFISHSSIVHADTIGENCFIMDLNNIHPYTRIGNNVILSNCNHIGHHTVIEDHCFISSNVVVSGGVTIGEGSFLGVNATLRDHITIGRYNVIGAGALIMKDTGENQVFKVQGTLASDINSESIHEL